MKTTKRFLVFLLLLLSYSNIFANHIIGGEMYYTCLGGNNYKITLKLYKECESTANFDDPATIFIFNQGNFVKYINFPSPIISVLPLTTNDPCFPPTGDICVEQAIYETTTVLPAVVGGYDITYQRCCRNLNIQNVISTRRQKPGSTYTTHVPGSEVVSCNTSATYNYFPLTYLCVNRDLIFDHSASDADGDSLSYEFCDPLQGLDADNNSLDSTEVADAPPYTPVPWRTGYSASYPLDASPALAIDSKTGIITGTPNRIGLYSVGVCVSEYRNGQLVSVSRRDFQFSVVACDALPVTAFFEQTEFCIGYTVNFHSDLTLYGYHWDFGDADRIDDTANVQDPQWTYPDSGRYNVVLTANPGRECTGKDTVEFQVYPLLKPELTVPPDNCLDADFDFAGNNSNYTSAAQFQWNFGPNASPSTSNDINPRDVVYNVHGPHLVALTISENGCIKNDMKFLTVYEEPEADYIISATSQCNPTPIEFTNKTATGGLVDYKWDFGDGVTERNQLSPSHIYADTGKYVTKLMVTTINGCKDTTEQEISVNLLPRPESIFEPTPKETSIFYPEVAIVDSSKDAGWCEILWGDNTATTDCEVTHTYTKPGNYKVRQIVQNGFGCRDTTYADVIIRPETLSFIPNAFTPNDDGLNDVFLPKLFGVTEYRISIFNRWGEKVFESKDMTKGWDGTINGRLSPSDVFSYKITYVDDVENKERQEIGKITLIR